MLHDSKVAKMALKNADCYFYYYSTCTKGDACSFRHEPAALKNERMCFLWLSNKCFEPHCHLRHMEIKKNRRKIPCYHETQPGGCQKEHCPFLHGKSQETNTAMHQLSLEEARTKTFMKTESCDTASSHPKKFRAWAKRTRTPDSSNNERLSLHLSKSRSITPFELAKCLSEFSGFATTLLQLVECYHYTSIQIKIVASTNDNVFHLEGEVVSLRPQITLCQTYSLGNDCNTQAKCFSLHICQDFLRNKCNEEKCLKEHCFKSQHNKIVINNFKLSLVSSNLLILLLSQHVLNNTSMPVSSVVSSRYLGGTQGQNCTKWSYDFDGEVNTPEICYKSVVSLCPLEESGCPQLHSDFHYYWQVKSMSNPHNCWVNLIKYQVIALEKAYCDPNLEATTLPTLDSATLSSAFKKLLLILNGKSQWRVNFSSMELTLPDHPYSLSLRRLCTQSNGTTLPDPSTFLWYFMHESNQWVLYGNTNPPGTKDLQVNVNSADIEKHFQEQPTSLYSFKSNTHSYSLDVLKMVQMNVSTGVARKVRRRPKPHINEVGTSPSIDLPSHWEPMNTTERFRLVEIFASSEEYQKVLSLIENHVSYNIKQIQRVQTPYFWRAFQNKVQELAALDNVQALNIQQLFHGTNPDTVHKICNENFDWRLHGSNAGQSYGRGTYFSPKFSYSYSYTSPDSSCCRFIFVARVAVGSISLGNSSITRPPINPKTSMPYDSTVDTIQNPSIIVKYDKQEYFPEYIVTLQG